MKPIQLIETRSIIPNPGRVRSPNEMRAYEELLSKESSLCGAGSVVGGWGSGATGAAGRRFDARPGLTDAGLTGRPTAISQMAILAPMTALRRRGLSKK